MTADQMREVVARAMSDTYPSGNPYPILLRLDLDAKAPAIHPDYFRTDAADAAWSIRQRDAEITRLRDEVDRLRDAEACGMLRAAEIAEKETAGGLSPYNLRHAVIAIRAAAAAHRGGAGDE